MRRVVAPGHDFAGVSYHPPMTSRRAGVLCVVGMTLYGLYYWATLPIEPSLLDHPVLLELLRGSISGMITAGAFARIGHAALAVVLLAPLPILMLNNPLAWWAGRIWGQDVVRMLVHQQPRAQRKAERAIRWAERYGSWAVVFAYFLPAPSVLLYAAAGWSGMSLRRFLALDLLGTFMWIFLNVGLGYWIGKSAVSVARSISHYGLWLSLFLLVAMFLVSIRRSSRLVVEMQPPVADAGTVESDA